ncbi:sensor histidine kinase [Aureimonas psammosilenae]|uniref:sensor histidine kinase n=1 Tax=Aureimonas psammosilenae TaxID=2495496 RepID=UPI001261182D|nr:sensor histidine kinase [Aureimonas psammosilenae]
MRLSVPTSLRGRLMAIAAIATTLATLAAAAAMAFTLHRFITHQLDLRLDAQAISLLNDLHEGPRGDIVLAEDPGGPPFDRPNPGWFWQIDVEGAPPFLAPSLDRRGPLNVTATEPEPDIRGRRPRMRSRPVAIEDADGLYARVLSAAVGSRPVRIVVTAPIEAIGGPMRDAMTPVVLSMVALGLGLLLATRLQVGYGLKPLEALGRDLAAVRSGARRAIPTDQPDEIKPLATELNSLIAENAAGLERARRHVANLAHGLKTPLADLALSLENRDPDGSARALVDDMDGRVRHHLARARAAALGHPARATTPVRRHIDDLAAVLARVYAERGLRFEIEVPHDLAVSCEPQDFDEMAGNLLDNACKWAGSRILVGARRDAGTVVLTVDDDGKGLAAGDVPEAMVAGRRLDEMQPGHGFGLSITRELAELYGGSLAIGPSTLNGLAARLTLPVPRG